MKLARRSPQTTYSGRFKDRIASSGVKACKQNPVPVSRRFRTTRRIFSAKLPADPEKSVGRGGRSAARRQEAFITLDIASLPTREGKRGSGGTICERQISKGISARPVDRSGAGGQVAYGRPAGGWLLLRRVRARRVPPGETSHSYKTDGLVAPRVSPGSRLASECCDRPSRARANERTDRVRPGGDTERANRPTVRI